ncbi:MAG: hypothetical protein J4428_00370 [Candidatus Aenigmarchaeota archaeon]|nr:hypothetical protein [Candidatus Aenigmarchaeota archaeon]
MGRLTCKLDSSHTFHPKTNPPEVEGKCNHDSGELYVRKDDDPKVVERRLNEYNAALPVVDFYAKQGRLLTVNGVAGIPDISTVLAYQVGFVLAEVERLHGRDPALIMDKMVQFYKS